MVEIFVDKFYSLLEWHPAFCTGTDPEKYQRGWLAQKFSSCNCHNNLYRRLQNGARLLHNRWYGHAGGLSFRK